MTDDLECPPSKADVRARSIGGNAAVVAAAAGLVTMVLIACTAAGRTQVPSAVAVIVSPIPTPAASAQPPTPSPNELAGLKVHSVSELLELRSAGRIGDEPVALRGFWTDRGLPRTCVPAEKPPGELQIRCYDGEWGITERDEPIGTWTVDFRFLPPDGPALTPFVDEALAQRLFTLPFINGQHYPPVPIVVVGHFDDPRADDCQPDARQLCRDRLVIDEIVEFDPQAVPTPAVTPSPTPFPFDDPPPAPFTAAKCAGDVPYSFVGWGRLSDYGLDIGGDEVVYLVVTREQQQGAGRKICWANEWDQGSYAGTTIP